MAQNSCSIIMYHYVRPLLGTRFAKLKALDFSSFERQLDYLLQEYNFVTPDDVVNSIEHLKPLPEKAVLLTFDDGYRDHFDYVYPLLKSKGIVGVFFPPTGAIYENVLLDVNRLHFVLASVDPELLVERLEDRIVSSRQIESFKSISEYRALFFKNNRYDSDNVAYFKRMLQHVLPEKFRSDLSKDLFAEYVDSDEKQFCHELYMTPSELKEMKKGGMEIGSHGHSHYWLEKIGMQQQINDIETSLSLLKQDNLLSEKFWFCYPYGSHNEATQRILGDRGCGAAVTVDPSLATCDKRNSLTLPRFDTNDFPS